MDNGFTNRATTLRSRGEKKRFMGEEEVTLGWVYVSVNEKGLYGPGRVEGYKDYISLLRGGMREYKGVKGPEAGTPRGNALSPIFLGEADTHAQAKARKNS